MTAAAATFEVKTAAELKSAPEEYRTALADNLRHPVIRRLRQRRCRQRAHAPGPVQGRERRARVPLEQRRAQPAVAAAELERTERFVTRERDDVQQGAHHFRPARDRDIRDFRVRRRIRFSPSHIKSEH